MRRAQCFATLAIALTLEGAAARGQAWPERRGASLPPWSAGSVAPDVSLPASAPPLTVPEEDRAAVDRAALELGRGRASSVVSSLAELVRRRGLDPRGYDTAAVLLRLATGAMPAARRRAASGVTLPAPPDEREASERTIDGAVELLIRREARAAEAWMRAAERAAAPLDAYHPLRVLGRVARVMADAARSPLDARDAAPLGPVAGRGRGTIDGGEAVLLYSLGAVYGLTLGAWGAVAITGEGDDVAPIASVGLPVLGAGVGLVAAALLDGRRDLRRGRVYAANAGFYLGLVGAFGVTLMPDGPLRDASRFERTTALLVGGSAGLGVGVAVAHATDAMPGSGSFVLSGGVWGALIGGALDRAFREGGSDAAVGLLVGEVIGAGAALLTASTLRPTPAQTRWLDLGALLGALSGALLLSQSGSSQTTSLASAIGCLGGGALGFALGAPSEGERELTRRLSRWEPRLTPTFSPVQGGGVFGLAL